MTNYKEKTVFDLFALCTTRGIEFNNDMSKEDLIKLLLKKDFDGKTKAELIAVCEEEGYKVSSGAKKDEILEALVEILASKPVIGLETESSDDEPAAEEDIPERPGFPDGLYEEEKSEAAPAEEPAAASDAEKTGKQLTAKELRDMADDILKKDKKTSGRKAAAKEAAKEARAKRRENIARVNEATLKSEDSIDKRAYGDDADLSPRQVRNAPQNLSISGERLRTLDHGEEDDIDLIESFNNAAYIPHGRVSKTTPPRLIRMTNPETGEEQQCVNVSAIVEYGSRMFYIPARYFFDDYFSMDQDKIRQFMQGRIGSEVDFRVVHIDRTDPANPVYTASRIAAMKKKRCDFWYSERQKGRSLIQPGSTQQARVVAVSERLVFVELFGAEVKVEPSEIAYEYVVDARNYYVPGDIVLVKIKSATLQDKDRAAALGYPVKCEVSLKDVYEDPKKRYFDQQMWGASFSGTVANITIGENNVVNFFVDDGRIDILCHLQKGITKMPQRGDTVVGKITGMDEATGYIWGVIQHINPSRHERRARPESFILKR